MLRWCSDPFGAAQRCLTEFSQVVECVALRTKYGDSSSLRMTSMMLRMADLCQRSGVLDLFAGGLVGGGSGDGMAGVTLSLAALIAEVFWRGLKGVHLVTVTEMARPVGAVFFGGPFRWLW